MATQGLEFEKPTLVDGGHEQKAIVNTASGKQPVNAPTVEDIKRIAKGEAEQAAEAASATEWEKSVKDYISYTNRLNINSDIDVNGYDIYGVEDTITNSVSCNALYSNNDEKEVLASNLLDGGRVFRHMLNVELNVNGEDCYLMFGITTSSPTEIDSADALEENYDACHYASGKLFNSEDNTTQVVIIEDVESIGVNVLLANGTLISGTFVAIEDVVTQC